MIRFSFRWKNKHIKKLYQIYKLQYFKNKLDWKLMSTIVFLPKWAIINHLSKNQLIIILFTYKANYILIYKVKK